MKSLFSIAAAATLMLGAAGAATAEPTYKAKGVPITPHQVGVLGSVLRMVHIQEQMPTSAVTAAGMPASPHQMAVLAPRQSEQQVVARGRGPLTLPPARRQGRGQARQARGGARRDDGGRATFYGAALDPCRRALPASEPDAGSASAAVSCVGYCGARRSAPSRRMVSPFSIGLSRIWRTSMAYSSGRPRRLGNGTAAASAVAPPRAGRAASASRRCRARWSPRGCRGGRTRAPPAGSAPRSRPSMRHRPTGRSGRRRRRPRRY